LIHFKRLVAAKSSLAFSINIMRKHFNIFILILGIGLLSCSSCIDKRKDNATDSFKQLLKKFKILKLPLQIREGEIETNGLAFSCDKNSKSDTSFIKFYCMYYGMLPDTNNFYALIVLNPADIILPTLITFDKTGKKINEEILCVSGCGGGGPGLDCNPQTTIIENDLTIYCVDTIRTVEFDRKGNPIESTRKYYCEYKNGKLNSNGKITMTTEQTKDLK